MALIVDQPSNFKHFCKICRKGFTCGRALGGHMRAHGMRDESDNEESLGDWEDKQSESIPPGNKRMSALRTNPNRCKSARSCENCGKEFSSWKWFLEHGKCVDVESLVSSRDSDDDDDQGHKGSWWYKRKRTMRIKVDNVSTLCSSNEEEDLATCLMMLSNSMVSMEPSSVEPDESCASANRDEDRKKTVNFMSPFAYQADGPSHNNNFEKSRVSRGLFECNACKKVFNSHQALGGHRASHKKVKGCFAAKQEQVDEYVSEDDVITREEIYPTPKSASSIRHVLEHGSSCSSLSTSKRKSKVHECSICHRVFSSGQALGGHKRCHWITSNSPDTDSLAKLQQFHDHLEQIQQSRPPNNKFDIDPDSLVLKLNLNLPTSSQYDLTRAQPDRVINTTPLHTGLEFSTEMYLKCWLGIDAKEREVQNDQHDNHRQHIHSHKRYLRNHNNHNNENIYLNKSNEIYTGKDEGDSKVKLAKLNELKDLNRASSSSSWLQVGIGSTTDQHGRANTTII